MLHVIERATGRAFLFNSLALIVPNKMKGLQAMIIFSLWVITTYTRVIKSCNT